jgi:hypothetical protein
MRTISGRMVATTAYCSLCRKRLVVLFSGLGTFMWITVHTQIERVKTHDVTRPMVPLPDGSGTYAGSEGLVGAEIVGVSNMVIQMNIVRTNCGKRNIASELGNGD